MVAPIRNRCQPAFDVIRRLGGAGATARLCGVNQSTVSRWVMIKEMRGTGGRIPQKYWPVILNHAKRTGMLIDIYTLSGVTRPKA